MKHNIKMIFNHAWKTAIILTAFAFIGTAMLSFVFNITKGPIEANEKEARLSLFKEILPENTYDNDLLKNTIQIAPNALLGNSQPSIANIAKLKDKSIGVILEAVAHDGYSGDIKLLVAIREDGSISGVRVLAHKETPGLGDYIDSSISDWINIFNNKSISNSPPEKWHVKKDGGQFDYMVGATITPRAIVKAVFNTLKFYELNKKNIFSEHKKTS